MEKKWQFFSKRCKPKWDQKYVQLYDTHERDAIVAREAFGQADAN
jgi:hypothetical protein